MKFKDFNDFHNFIRRYNSLSLIDFCSQGCWSIFLSQDKGSDYGSWLRSNIYRNYLVRILLLSTAANQHRHETVHAKDFKNLVDYYFSWENHTISNSSFLLQEAESTIQGIQEWETSNNKSVRNWSIRLSDLLSAQLLESQSLGEVLFMQRMVFLQNSGFGYQLGRIHRVLKIFTMMDNSVSSAIAESIQSKLSMSIEEYFRQFIAAIGICSKSQGKCDFNNLPNLDLSLVQKGITKQSLMSFLQSSSQTFHVQMRQSVNNELNSLSDFYKPFIGNLLLCYPFCEIKSGSFILPDPISLTESCWNQVLRFVPTATLKGLPAALSSAFENYVYQCFPVSPHCRISKIEESHLGKRADFLVEHPNFYIVVECKNSLANLNAITYFQPHDLSTLWCRMHSACEQISSTIKALNLQDKPVIPLILSFYDSLAAGNGFKSVLSNTEYFTELGLFIQPEIYSLHEFEHVTYNKSIDSWAKSIILCEEIIAESNDKGHNYSHLKDFSLF